MPQELLDVYLAPLSKAGLPPLSLQEGEEVPKTMGRPMGVGWLGVHLVGHRGFLLGNEEMVYPVYVVGKKDPNLMNILYTFICLVGDFFTAIYQVYIAKTRYTIIPTTG